MLREVASSSQEHWNEAVGYTKPQLINVCDGVRLTCLVHLDLHRFANAFSGMAATMIGPPFTIAAATLLGPRLEWMQVQPRRLRDDTTF